MIDWFSIFSLSLTLGSLEQAKTYDALTLHREASVVVYGTLAADERAKGGVELHADYWEVIGKSDESIESRFNQVLLTESHQCW